MKITQVAVNNFMSIGRADFGLDDKGLVLIQGENRDDTSQNSNGAGKSSLPDAICWCLFGTTSRGMTADAVVNRNAGKECIVQLHIEDDGVEWRIRRARKAKISGLSVFRDSVEITGGTDKITQELVERIVGCSYEVFKSAVYCAQDSMPDLPGSTDKYLKELVEEAAGVNRLAEAHEIAKSKYKDVENSLHMIDLDVEKTNALLDHVKEELGFNSKKSKDWTDKKVLSLKEIKTTIDSKKALYDKYKDIASKKHEGTVDEIADKLGKALADKKEAEAERTKELMALNTASAVAQMTFSAERKEVHRLQTLIPSIRADIYELRKEAQSKATCPMCGEPIKDQEAVKKTTEKKLHDLETALENAIKEESAAQNRLQEAEQEDNRVKVRLLELRTAPPTEFDEAIQQLTSMLLEARELASKMDTLVKELKVNVETYKKLLDQEDPYAESIRRNQADIDRINADLKELQSNIEAGEYELDILTGVIKVFSRSGVRAHILDTVTPFLNDRTAVYLNALTDGNISAIWSTLSSNVKGEAVERFNIDVQSKVGAAHYNGLSGGEKRKVKLACAMALQDLVSSRAVKPIELFIADEIDDALDDQGLERLMGILDEKAKTKGTVLVISHNSLSDWIRQSIVMIKSGGYTYLEAPL